MHTRSVPDRHLGPHLDHSGERSDADPPTNESLPAAAAPPGFGRMQGGRAPRKRERSRRLREHSRSDEAQRRRRSETGGAKKTGAHFISCRKT